MTVPTPHEVFLKLVEGVCNAYDGQYVVLAEYLGCPPYTDDANFAGSTGHGVEIWRPSSGIGELIPANGRRAPSPAVPAQNLR